MLRPGKEFVIGSDADAALVPAAKGLGGAGNSSSRSKSSSCCVDDDDDAAVEPFEDVS